MKAVMPHLASDGKDGYICTFLQSYTVILFLFLFNFYLLYPPYVYQKRFIHRLLVTRVTQVTRLEAESYVPLL
jgi:hypothetical protein